jgi:hypothetical protein
MAVEFQYLLANQICGPCSFEDLVVLVRDGVLSADDLVKPSSDDRWIPAATIYGLFHMAGRQYVLTQWEQKRQRDEDALEYDSYDSVELEKIRTELIARQQLDDFDQQSGTEFESVQTAELQTAELQTEREQQEQKLLEEQRTQEQLDFALAVANELKSEKRPGRRRRRIRRFLAAFFSK